MSSQNDFPHNFEHISIFFLVIRVSFEKSDAGLIPSPFNEIYLFFPPKVLESYFGGKGYPVD